MRPTHMGSRPAALHWPEYFIEAGAIGMFMVSAAVFTAILYHPWSTSPLTSQVSGSGAG